MRTRAAASAPALLQGSLMLNMPISLSRAASACSLPTARCAYGSVFSITCSVGARSCSVQKQSSAALKSASLPGAPLHASVRVLAARSKQLISQAQCQMDVIVNQQQQQSHVAPKALLAKNTLCYSHCH